MLLDEWEYSIFQFYVRKIKSLRIIRGSVFDDQ